MQKYLNKKNMVLSEKLSMLNVKNYCIHQLKILI